MLVRWGRHEDDTQGEQHVGMHGLLGQTWRRHGDAHERAYAHKQFQVEGDVMDYVVDSLLGVPAMYNLYE